MVNFPVVIRRKCRGGALSPRPQESLLQRANRTQASSDYGKCTRMQTTHTTGGPTNRIVCSGLATNFATNESTLELGPYSSSLNIEHVQSCPCPVHDAGRERSTQCTRHGLDNTYLVTCSSRGRSPVVPPPVAKSVIPHIVCVVAPVCTPLHGEVERSRVATFFAPSFSPQ